MGAALKAMVPDVVDNTHVFALHNVFTGYMGSSTRDIVNHMMY